MLKIVFGEQTDDQNMELVEDQPTKQVEGEEESCHECAEKDQNLAKHKKEANERYEWYDKEIENLGQKLANERKKREDQVAILKEQAMSLKEKYNEGVIELNTLKDRCNEQPSCSSSAVAQAVAGIVGKWLAYKIKFQAKIILL